MIFLNINVFRTETSVGIGFIGIVTYIINNNEKIIDTSKYKKPPDLNEDQKNDNKLMENFAQQMRIYNQYSKRDIIYLRSFKYWLKIGPTSYLHKNNDFTNSILNNNDFYSIIINEFLRKNNETMIFYRSSTKEESHRKQFLHIKFESELLKYDNKNFKIEKKEQAEKIQTIFNLLNYVNLCDPLLYLRLKNIKQEELDSKFQNICKKLWTNFNITDISDHPYFSLGGKCHDEIARQYVNIPNSFLGSAGVSLVLACNNRGNYALKMGSINVPIGFFGFICMFNIYLTDQCGFVGKNFEILPKFKKSDFFFIIHGERFGIGLSIRYIELFQIIMKLHKVISDYFFLFNILLYFRLKFSQNEDKSYNNLHIIIYFDVFSYSFYIFFMVYFALSKIMEKNQGINIPSKILTGTSDKIDNLDKTDESQELQL